MFEVNSTTQFLRVPYNFSRCKKPPKAVQGHTTTLIECALENEIPIRKFELVLRQITFRTVGTSATSDNVKRNL